MNKILNRIFILVGRSAVADVYLFVLELAVDYKLGSRKKLGV